MKKYKNKPNTIVNIENDNNFVQKNLSKIIYMSVEISYIYINIYVYIVVNYSNKT